MSQTDIYDVSTKLRTHNVYVDAVSGCIGIVSEMIWYHSCVVYGGIWLGACLFWLVRFFFHFHSASPLCDHIFTRMWNEKPADIHNSIRRCFVHGSQVTRECFTSYQSEFCLHADNNVLCNQCADKLKTRNSSLLLFCCFDLCFCWHDFQHSYHFTHSHEEHSLRYRVNRKLNEIIA